VRVAIRLALAALVLTTGASAATVDDPVVARIAGTDLHASEVKHLVDGLDPAQRKQATSSTKALAALVRAELGRRAVLEEAKHKNWEQRPEIAARIERARTDVIVTSYLGAMAGSVPDPDEDQVRRAYEANQSRFVLPRRYHLAQIVESLPEGQAKIDEAKARADSLANKAKAAGADFAQLARTGSDDKASAEHGGDLGWVRDDDLVPALAGIVRGLADGEVSGAIQAKDGWHILREIQTKPAGPAPLDEVRASIVAALRQQAAANSENQYVDKLLASDKAAVNEIELARLADPGTN